MANTTKGQATKQHILDTAKSLFHEKGYDQTSIKNIIEASYIAKGTLYLYFEDKLDIMHHLVEAFVGHFKSVLQEALDELDNTSSSSDYILTKAIDDIFNVCIAYKCCFVFFHETQTAVLLKEKDYLNQFNQMNRAGIQSMIQVGIDKGDFRRLNTELYADIIYEMIHSFIEKTILDNKDYAYIILAKKELSDSLIRILKKRD